MVPANGIPTTLKQLCFCVFHFICFRKTNFDNDFAYYLKIQNCYSVNSGRAALYFALSNMISVKPNAKKVLMPVMTCQSVYFAVIKAGLFPVFYDIDKNTLGSNIKQITVVTQKFDDVLCVIAGSLFGFTFDIKVIQEFAQQNNIFLLEDVAQSLGSEWNGQKLGCFGDASIFSFGKSKNITAINGGMLVINNKILNERIKLQYQKLPQNTIFNELKTLFTLFLYAIVIRPCVYNILVSLNIKLINLQSHSHFEVRKMGRLEKIIGSNNLKKLAALNSIRIKNAQELYSIFKDIRWMELINFNPDKSVYLRMPVFIKTPELKQCFINSMIDNGIWAGSRGYPLLISEHESSQYPHAFSIKESIVILPTHPYLRKKDFKKIKMLLTRITADGQ